MDWHAQGYMSCWSHTKPDSIILRQKHTEALLFNSGLLSKKASHHRPDPVS
jgi:hypothetical protein